VLSLKYEFTPILGCLGNSWFYINRIGYESAGAVGSFVGSLPGEFDFV
jgi:hypothetical protein